MTEQSTYRPILISGLINLETTLRVDGFPIAYEPVRYPFFGVQSAVSGVGFNIAKALTTLGDPVRFLSLVGNDAPGKIVQAELAACGIPGDYVLNSVHATAQSVILYDRDGRRQIHVDLKDIQERDYPPDLYEQAAEDCDLAVLCNINFSRPLLEKARRAGLRVATDVHTVASLEDGYNCDFMTAADILFLSDEALPCPPGDFARLLWERYGTAIVVIGLGAQGALLGVRADNFLERIPAVFTRPVVNTIGAGDALFSAFLHYFHKNGDAYEAMQKAVLFASWKIGESGAASGFLGEAALGKLANGANHA